MAIVLQGLPRVVCYVDDVLVTSTSDPEHLSHLAKVLDHLQSYGFWVKEEKCANFQDTYASSIVRIKNNISKPNDAAK